MVLCCASSDAPESSAPRPFSQMLSAEGALLIASRGLRRRASWLTLGHVHCSRPRAGRLCRLASARTHRNPVFRPWRWHHGYAVLRRAGHQPTPSQRPRSAPAGSIQRTRRPLCWRIAATTQHRRHLQACRHPATPSRYRVRPTIATPTRRDAIAEHPPRRRQANRVRRCGDWKFVQLNCTGLTQKAWHDGRHGSKFATKYAADTSHWSPWFCGLRAIMSPAFGDPAARSGLEMLTSASTSPGSSGRQSRQSGCGDRRWIAGIWHVEESEATVKLGFRRDFNPALLSWGGPDEPAALMECRLCDGCVRRRTTVADHRR